MELDNSKLPINILLDKINEAAKGNQGMNRPGIVGDLKL